MTKHLQKLFALVLVCCAFLSSSSAWGQVQYEPFSTTGSLTTTSGWTNNTGTAGQLQVIAGNLSYSNLPTPEGNKVALKSTDSEDAKLALTNSPTSGSIYASFVFKPESGFLANTTSGNYFTHFIADNANTYVTRVSIREGSTANTFNIGVLNYSGGTSTAVDIFGANPVDYALGQTYLVVLKYDISSNTSSVWINPTLGGGEPSALVSNSAGSTPSVTQITGYGIRQSNSGGLGTGNMEIDEVRIGTTWAAVTPTGTASTTPTITVSKGSLDFGDKLLNTTVVGSYMVSASNIGDSENVVLTADAPFTISTSETGSYSSTLTLTGAELATNQTIFVKVTPTVEGELTGKIVHTATGAANVEVSLLVYGSSAYSQSFDRCSTELPGGWMQYSVTGAQTWSCTAFGIEDASGSRTNGVQMSGYEGGANANADWLISPKLDIISFTYPLLSFNYRTKFTGDALDVRVSTDYSGSGDPSAATWTTIETLEADDADAWKTFENFNLEAYKSANTYIAFVYTSTTSSAARWTLDNFELQNVANYINTSDFNLSFDETAVGNVSAPQQFTFEAKGFAQDVIVAAPANFELSKDGVTYSSTLTYTPAEAATSNNVFVRFKPVTAVAFSSGPVSFTSGTEPSVTRGMLSGSSILRSATLDVATWNLEWFGSTSNGPSDEDLQFANVRLGLDALDADIIALQEVVDETRAQLLAQQLGYNYISEKITDWQSSNDQIVAFMYNPNVVTVKKEKVLLKKLYQDIRSGSTTLTDYPTGNSNLLWASGRLPYLVQFEASIDGVKQTYNLINIHAKANDGDDMVQYNRRKYDLQVLKDTLDAQYANMNLILLGDYNDDVDVSVVGTGNASTYEAFVTDEDYIALTYDLSTTGAATYESGSLQSFLDHQIISSTLQDEYIENSIHIESQLLSLIPNYRSTTSDHLPVSARFYIQSENTTGIADATKGQFRVYPNPFVTNVRLDLPERVTNRNISLVVYGVEGRKLLEATGTQEAVQQQLNDNLNNLSKGLYIIKVEAGSELFQSRMLKQ